MSYEYNQQVPRFFSKYFLEQNKTQYDLSISQIVEASVSQSEVFLPKIIGESLFLDVEILAKTPSMMAYLMAEHFVLPNKGSSQKIRMLSINCQERQHFNQSNENRGKPPSQWTERMRKNQFRFDFNDWQRDDQPEAHVANFLLSQKLGEEDYLQLISIEDQQSTIESPLEILRTRGELLFLNNRSKIEKFLKEILLERYSE